MIEAYKRSPCHRIVLGAAAVVLDHAFRGGVLDLDIIWRMACHSHIALPHNHGFRGGGITVRSSWIGRVRKRLKGGLDASGRHQQRYLL